jgi:secreted trypsin-like serine protease
MAAVFALGGVLFAVTFGQPDGNAHPYVGIILMQTASGLSRCTGTLVSPRLVVTAGHCTSEGGVANLATWVKFDTIISFPDREKYASLIEYLNAKKNGWIKGTAISHPQYDDSNFQSPDIGVVLLETDAPVSSYGSLPPENFLTAITSQSNNFTVVGYGYQGYIKPFAEYAWERYKGEVKLIELNSAANGGNNGKFTNNPGSTSGGSCFGDSGGPVFYANSNMITAVVSWGITPCIGVDYQARTDTATALDFVRQYLP